MKVKVTSTHFLKRNEIEYFDTKPVPPIMQEKIDKEKKTLLRVAEDDPKSWSYIPPLRGKNPAQALLRYHRKRYKNRRYKTELILARDILKQTDYKFACRVVRYFGKYGLKWISNNMDKCTVQLKEFATDD